MDNDLIPEKKWWQNWKWSLPLSAIATIGIGIFVMVSQVQHARNERVHGWAFEPEKWNAKGDSTYIYRNKMLKDLMSGDTLRH